MKTLLQVLLFFVASVASAQGLPEPVVYLTTDSIPYKFEENWLFKNGDDSTWATAVYDDSGWLPVHPLLERSKHPDIKLNGIGWLRLHIYTDASLIERTLALKIQHLGASEVYLDGRKVAKFGQIGDAKTTEYHNPHGRPVVINIDSAGHHLLAVRYANFFAGEMSEKYADANVGISMTLNDANGAVMSYVETLISFAASTLPLSGMLAALCAVHFLLWLFRRRDISNLYFSIFCFSLGAAFFLPYFNFVSSNPKVTMWVSYIGVFIGSAIFFSLSAISNSLFSRSMIRFYIIAAMCILPLPVAYFNMEAATFLLVAIMVVTTLESIILPIRGIYKKQRGAKIIGFGVLFFTLFIVLLIVLAALNGGSVVISGDSFMDYLLLILLVAAILSIPVSMSVFLAWNFALMSRDLNKQLEQVKLLSEKTLAQELEKQHMLENRQEELEREVAARTEELAQQHEELKQEKHKSDELLRNILPEEVAEELKNKGASEARYFDHVTVMFTDFVDFTKAGERMTPQELVNELHTCFKAFDNIISRYHIEKIKTIGDAYLAVCGLPAADSQHAENTVKAALEIRQYMKERKRQMPDKTFDIRIGIHSGAVVAGIVGVKKFAYDIWGDTVNTAARMDSGSEPDKINISYMSYDLIVYKFNCTL